MPLVAAGRFHHEERNDSTVYTTCHHRLPRILQSISNPRTVTQSADPRIDHRVVVEAARVEYLCGHLFDREQLLRARRSDIDSLRVVKVHCGEHRLGAVIELDVAETL